MVRSRMDDGNWRREWEEEQELTPQEKQEQAKQEAEDREMEELYRLSLQDMYDEEDEQRRAWEGHGGFEFADDDDLSYLNDDDYEDDFDLDDNVGRSICGPRESEGW